MQALSEALNDNDKLNNLINDNDKHYFDQHSDHKLNNVRIIARKLEEELNDPGGRDFFLKCAWRLPEATIYNNLEAAKKGRDPKKLFTWLCNRNLKALGV
jgi:hypothetical protein